jgi:hypothetical protein
MTERSQIESTSKERRRASRGGGLLSILLWRQHVYSFRALRLRFLHRSSFSWPSCSFSSCCLFSPAFPSSSFFSSSTPHLSPHVPSTTFFFCYDGWYRRHESASNVKILRPPPTRMAQRRRHQICRLGTNTPHFDEEHKDFVQRRLHRHQLSGPHCCSYRGKVDSPRVPHSVQVKLRICARLFTMNKTVLLLMMMTSSA